MAKAFPPNNTLAAARESLDIVEEIEARNIRLDQRGSLFMGCCPFHDDHKPSMWVSPTSQRFGCFGCSAEGDVLDFITRFEGTSLRHLLHQLNTSGRIDPSSPKAMIRRTGMDRAGVPVPLLVAEGENVPALMKADGSTIPVERFQPPKGETTLMSYRPEMVHAYRDLDGKLRGYVLRLERYDNTGERIKIPLPVTYCVWPDGSRKWTNLGFGRPRPFYNLNRLGALLRERRLEGVLVVEGEKAADVGSHLLDEMGWAVITWPGGAKAVSHADFDEVAQILAMAAVPPGTPLVFWPDLDVAGASARDQFVVEMALRERETLLVDPWALFGCANKDGNPEDESLKGYDIADLADHPDDWPVSRIVDVLMASQPATFSAEMAEELSTRRAEDGDAAAAPTTADGAAAGEAGDGTPDRSKLSTLFNIRALGYDGDLYFYLSSLTGQIITLKPSEHKGANLFRLAPRDLWEGEYPPRGPRATEPDWTRAADDMMAECHERGLYDPSRLRGTGVWYDRGHAKTAAYTVVHLGDRLLVNGMPMELDQFDGEFIYERRQTLVDNLNLERKLTAEEGRELFKLICDNSWKNPVHGLLCAGYVTGAPICGSLDWRPNLWLTGGSGSGKTWFLDNIVTRLLDNFPIYVAAGTTEAGIRQSLRNDARAVIYEEAESEDEKTQRNIQTFLSMLRGGTSNGRAAVVKGTAGGAGPIATQLRSMVMFNSIGVGLHLQADENRVSVVELASAPPQSDQAAVRARHHRFEDYARRVNAFITDERVQAFHARVLGMIATVRSTWAVAKQVMKAKLGDNRLGDQLGMLVALAWCLQSDHVATEAEIQALVDQYSWDDFLASGRKSDGEKIIDVILQSHIRHESGTMAISELLDMVDMQRTGYESAAVTLARHGLRISWSDERCADGRPRRKEVWVANHKAITELLEDSAWSKTWSQIISQVPGAEKAAQPKKFAGGLARYTAVPAEFMLAGAEIIGFQQHQLALTGGVNPPHAGDADATAVVGGGI